MNAAAHSLFHTVPHDPIHVLQYTLPNGLRLFFSVNKEQPRVYTEIAVRVGSKHDPAETTGLAHYFEHMMFKGTDRMGTLDWQKEKALLDRIEQLFEQHRAEQDPAQKRTLYAEIDRLSSEAARYAAANEYDKLVSAMGAKGTNAYTWVEQTVYLNDIPANELERWFQLESERFRRPVLRLFHTELETVFEEYNISQDRDFRKVMKSLQEVLTPTHPYGTQTTLGRGEDLKNPSQTNIYRFFDTYYVPNNMAMILCGDFDPQEALLLANKYFGHFPAKPIPKFQVAPQPPLTTRVQREVYGNEAPWVELAWRFPGAASPEARLLPLLAGMLYNEQAGLFDINLTQSQQVLEAYAYHRTYEDYSSLVLHAKPREGQTLEQLETLLLQQVALLREGRFEAWLPEAVVNDLKLGEMKAFEKNEGRAGTITSAFVLGLDWKQVIERWKILEQVTAGEVMQFAAEHLRADNFAAVYKHHGPDPQVMKVDKPDITPVEVNRQDHSAFAHDFLAESMPDIEPQFVDFKQVFQHATVKPGQRLKVVQDKENGLFRLFFTFDMGKNSDPRLSVVAQYLNFLGTDRYTAAEMQQAFFRLGVHFSANCHNEYFYLTLSGLNESYAEGVALLFHLLANARPNAEALDNLVADILQRRENDKKDKKAILQKGMLNYAHYGPVSPFTHRLTREALKKLTAEELTGLLRGLLDYRYELFYTGPLAARTAVQPLKKHAPQPDKLLAPIPPRRFPEKGVRRDRVLFVHFPMVQVELMLLSKGTPRFDLNEYILSDWYNQYFGFGLSSIVFQEIRESKALAYSAYAYSGVPDRKNRAHFMRAYVGTQPDKLREAVTAFQSILENMPVSTSQMSFARQSVLKQIAASRISRADLYWNWRSVRDRGYRHDLREDKYRFFQQATPDSLTDYHARHIKGRHYTWLVLGDRDRVDFAFLKTIGKVKELTLGDIFGE
ncbi:MAG: insulinase family protein [Saprospiraceae bacterium]|nr:insulinase family protein [Saprospiraceae bacterium]